MEGSMKSLLERIKNWLKWLFSTEQSKQGQFHGFKRTHILNSGHDHS